MFFYLFLLSVSDIGDWEMNLGYFPRTSVRQTNESVTLGALATKTATVTNKTK